jgi:hypothetical protein
MVTTFLGLDMLFWAAMALTLVYFLDLATCWWFNRLGWSPLKRWRNTLVSYHKYTRWALFVLIIAHGVLHIRFQVFGIPI